MQTFEDNNIQQFKRYYWVLTGVDNRIDYAHLHRALNTAYNARMCILWVTRIALPVFAAIAILCWLAGPAAFAIVMTFACVVLISMLATAAVLYSFHMKDVRYYSNLYWGTRVVPEGQEG